MTVNVKGDVVDRAKQDGYHAYYASGVTAIETGTYDRDQAHAIASKYGEVLYIFI